MPPRPIARSAAWIGLCAFLNLFTFAPLSTAEPTPLQPLASEEDCERCVGHLLPGRHVNSPRTYYRIDSDLPEIYYTNGVLYSTKTVLPPFKTDKGEPVPEEMRTQVNKGFRGIDDSFEVFLYHLAKQLSPDETRRIVVYVENIGDIAARIEPRQAMFHGGNAGTPTSVESQLGRAVFEEDWDTPVGSLTLEPGQGAVIGMTKKLNSKLQDDNNTAATFVTGIVRADVSAPQGVHRRPKLEVTVLSLPGSTDPARYDDAVAALMGTGADSGETYMDLLIPPPDCHLRRVVGTARNVLWQSDPVVIDVAALPEKDGGRVTFPMTLPEIQSAGCRQAQQTLPLLLHPPYVRPDSIGNYHMEYYVTMTLMNGGAEPKTVDLRYGKEDARVGLVWQMAVADEAMPLTELEKLPTIIGWAGKSAEGSVEPDYDESMLEAAGPLTLEPGESKTVSLRTMVLGTASLPYFLRVTAQ
ncbi:MAG: hypothetical protein RLY93_15035 [Sumerlaeia bacterium]